MHSHQQRLLGRLAELSWFTANGETAATRSLSMLLEDDHLRAATINFLSKVSDLDLSAVHRFLPEQVHADRARPDVEGLDIADRPLVVIEAKFGAALTVQQIRAYLDNQQRSLARGIETPAVGLFLLLVPQSRAAEANLKIASAYREQADSGDPYPSVPLVLTWDQWLDEWGRAAAAAADATTPDGLAADIVQLRAMCLALGGLFIAPLGAAASGAAWREREDELRAVVDQVTRSFANPQSNLYPIGDEPPFLARRYVTSGYRAEGKSQGSLAVGVHEAFADAGLTPIWLRFHRKTEYFGTIRDIVLASGFAKDARRDDEHLWLPLHVDPDLGGPDLVADLIRQVDVVRSCLAPRA